MATPIVFRVSEGVRPNATVSVYGEYFTGTPRVRFLRKDGSVATDQPALQTDPAGHFCRVVFPALNPGAYTLCVGNDAGLAARNTIVNRTEPRSISEEGDYPGLRLKLIGRNLDAAEYNGAQNTQQRPPTPRRWVSGSSSVCIATSWRWPVFSQTART